jgi:hypothetical protein
VEQSRSALTTSVALLCGGGCAILGRKICVPSSDFLPLPALSLSLSLLSVFFSRPFLSFARYDRSTNSPPKPGRTNDA